MELGQIGKIIWRHRVMAGIVLALTIAVALGSLVTQTRIYRATSTVALVPVNDSTAIYVLSQVATISPLYGEGVKSTATLSQAASRMQGTPLGRISVRTFSTPVVKIDADSPSREGARRSAQVVTDVLVERAGTGDVGIPQLRVLPLNRPTLPTSAYSPQPRLTLAFGILLGLGLAVGAALLRENLSGKVEDADTLSKVADAPVYGEIPSARTVPDVSSPDGLFADPTLRGVAEALRDLRTNIQFAGSDVRSVLVTSPEGRHGKTTVAFGLAVMFAKSGARTLLVDADLRRGRLADVLAIVPAPGLSEVLAGEPLAGALRKVGFPSLTVMPSGALLDDPGELLEQSFFSLLHRLEADFDMVVIDGTPLVPINDARIVARYTGMTLMVARAGILTRRQIRSAAERLSIISVPLSAVVLNHTRSPRRSSYHRYLEPAVKRTQEA